MLIASSAELRELRDERCSLLKHLTRERHKANKVIANIFE
ncbi:hypothetical protein C1A50_0787 [Paenibacillus polymyxa]|nr:hypothetical protein C1A50_0787 [Paenibacillus polymyxa]